MEAPWATSRAGMRSRRPIASSATRLGIDELSAQAACGVRRGAAVMGRLKIAKVRVTVQAGEVNVVREGSGTCEASAPKPGQAHELALKGAETDATKRALATPESGQHDKAHHRAAFFL